MSTASSIFDSNIKECTSGHKRSLLNTVKTLDFDMCTEFVQSERTVDELDYSRIVGFDLQEPDFYSDEEDVEDLYSWSYENEHKAGKVPIEYATLGALNVKCDKCEAWMWKEERTNKNVKRGRLEFSLCCAKGRVDHSINCGDAPYIYRLNGQNHHLFGPLIPDDGEDPKICQLYIYDTENEEDGLQRISDIHPKLMALQYPLMFPHGDEGFHVHLSYGNAENKSSRKRTFISQKEYYSYTFQVRRNEGMTPRLGGHDIKKSYFGKCLGVIYIVEFQNCGLPHVHMLIWLDSTTKNDLKKNVDNYVLAEIPDPEIDHSGNFLKKYSPSTPFDESGFPLYKRRNNGIIVNIKKQDLDNQWGHDRATVAISGRKRKHAYDIDALVDEINQYFDGRYVCAAETAHRIFGFNIHYMTTSVQRLSFHLVGNKTCTFRSNEPLEKVVSREKYKESQLEAFFTLNATDFTARQYTYDEILQHYVWNDVDRVWNVRKRGNQIGRLTDLRKFWNNHCRHMIDDILLMRRKSTSNEQLVLNDKQLEFYALAEIHKLLRSIGKSLKEFSEKPQPPKNYLDCDSAITRSRLWKKVKLNQLIHNMRINKGKNEAEVQRMKDFARWVLDIWDDNIQRAVNGEADDDITIPS
ncbi:hypothetical protein POM88_006740 [Heracleum sosnowskyi]|uniref:ATP-dependent DNA helicase n=1 Tax=Heracleum sosnowskyi TaxID=360622 RepID=A0AAD8J3A0_9APIA|nr:hypothetical protein POM88_006740 [Heracleum sosnowskyi]